MKSVTRRPSASAAAQRNIFSAAGLNSTIRRSGPVLMIASRAEAMMPANWCSVSTWRSTRATASGR
jgi:hypothetical protein